MVFPWISLKIRLRNGSELATLSPGHVLVDVVLVAGHGVGGALVDHQVEAPVLSFGGSNGSVLHLEGQLEGVAHHLGAYETEAHDPRA